MKLLEARPKTSIFFSGREIGRHAGSDNSRVEFLPISPDALVRRSEAEAKRTIAGIMNYHVDLLTLNPGQLCRLFFATISDPAIVRQQSRLPTWAATSISGDKEKYNSRDKEFIIRAYNTAFEAHQIMGGQWRKFSD